MLPFYLRLAWARLKVNAFQLRPKYFFTAHCTCEATLTNGDAIVFVATPEVFNSICKAIISNTDWAKAFEGKPNPPYLLLVKRNP